MPVHPALGQLLPFLNTYFLAPAGLLALLALLPLLLFYLMKPEPEERVLPSMTFFMEEERSGRVEQALRTLQRNLVLLLHVLLVIGIAAALAKPFVMGEQTTGTAVVVVDVSASMADDMAEMRGFVAEHAGKRTTLVVAGEHVSVPLEGVSRRRAVSEAGDLEARDVETDIRSALEVARGYDGPIAVASDLDQTVGGGDATAAVEQLQAAGRRVTVMDTAAGNRWGIVNVDIGRGNSSVDIKNVQETDASVTLRAGTAEQRIDIPAGAVETVTVPTPAGRTTLQLEEDPVPADNTAAISVPEQRSFEVLLISGTGNPYLETAVDLINFTTIDTASPPLNTVPDADVYIVGRSEQMLRSTAAELERRTRDGAGLVVVGQDGIFEKMSILPVERTGDRRNVTVEIREPRRVLVGETAVFGVKRTRGEALATHNALVRARHGKGEVVLYNLQDSDFHFDFLYPVFWKDLLGQLTDRPTVSERNRRTGGTLNVSRATTPDGTTAEGPVRLTDAGFYETGQATFTANLFSPDESGEEDITVADAATEGSGRTEKPLQPLAVALVLVLALGEFGYLRYRGSL